ncbi:MAG: CPBP family intramembrane metalloprotease [Paludibacteraceae bacterium]|nr:CPBP family intramembrane metalloprotease [Paludibacteraceae bacterium]
MLKSRHSNLHPLLKIAEWLLIMLVCTLLIFVIWSVLPIDYGSTGALLVFQALQAVGVFIVPTFVVAYLWCDSPMMYLHIGKNPGAAAQPFDWRLALLSMGVMITAIPLINCLVALNGLLSLPESMSGLEQWMRSAEEQAEWLLKRFMTYHDGAWWMLPVNIMVLAVLPAIGEELTFRGVLQSFFRNRHVAVWLTAFIFSFVHFQFYGFLPRLLLGAMLGYALVWSGRIGYSMLMHATNNALSVIVFYLGTYVWHIAQDDIDALGTGSTWWLTVLCTPLMLAMMYIFYRRCGK